MDRIELPRWGQQALVFQGELIASADDRHLPPNGGCWWELTLYRTELGTYVLAKAVCQADSGKRGRHEALCFESPGDVRAFLAQENRRKPEVAHLLLERAATGDHGFVDA